MPSAHLILEPRFTLGAIGFTLGAIDRRLFGSFVEHLGRCVYEGIYEPGHHTANARGFRTDVIELVRELGVSIVRYPGGNFVSGYRWEDGIGPKTERPTRLDLAWHSTETNEVGLDEFAGWLEDVGSDLMYVVNLGTRGVQEALDVLEYTNIRSGTTLSDARIANGRNEPYATTMWCLGNEMDGPWELGHSGADDYGKLASKTAKAMRQLNPSVELVVCGSSSAQMRTFGSWEHTVLKHTYDDVDFIACHAYYEVLDGDVLSFLASAVNMDRFIESVISAADAVQARARPIREDQHLLRCVECVVLPPVPSGREDHRPGELANRTPAARGQLLRVGCGGPRQPAYLAAETCGPRAVGGTRPAGQCHRADHDRAWRRCLA